MIQRIADGTMNNNRTAAWSHSTVVASAALHNSAVAIDSGLFKGHYQLRNPQAGSGDFQNLTGRVGSGQEMFKTSRGGSGRVRRSSNI